MGIHGLAESLLYEEDPAVRARLCFEMTLEEELFDAIEAGDLETVRYLLDHGMSARMMNSFTRCRVLTTAVEKGHLAIAKLARAYGADLVAFYEEEPAYCTPSDELLEFANPDVRRTISGAPREGGSKEVLEWLQSHPTKDRSMAPPIGAPLENSRRRELQEKMDEWECLKRTEKFAPR